MSVNLYINSKGQLTLSEFAQQAFPLLNISNFEERQSSNYPPDNHYFRSSALGLEVTIADADDSRLPELQFRVFIEPQRGRLDDDSFFEHIAKMVAYFFLKADFEVLKDEPFGRIEAKWYKYMLVDNKPFRKEEVVVEPI